MAQYCLQPRSCGNFEDNQPCCIDACSFQKQKFFTCEVDMINVAQYYKMEANEWHLFQVKKYEQIAYNFH